MRRLIPILLLTVLTGTASAQPSQSGQFDYFVLSLSWSPNWCATTGDAQQSDQCDARHDHGWILHGLWPQYQRGFPSDCQTAERPPSRAMTAAMSDIMGTSGLAWHQWKKHGTCSGLSAVDYFSLSRRAYDSVIRPEVFRKLEKTVALPASVVEEAFLNANPSLHPDMITVTCKDGHIQEARICLSRTLTTIPCGRDVAQDCRLKDALFAPVR
jgi:ribonuclease T2